MAEYEDRLGEPSRPSAGDLDRLTSDLPLNQISWHDPRRWAARHREAKRDLQVHVISYVAMSLLMIGIWLAVAIGAGQLVFLADLANPGVGIGVLAHALRSRGRGPACKRCQGRRFVNHWSIGITKIICG